MSFKTTVSIAGVTFKNEDGTHRQDLLGTLYDDYWTESLEGEEDTGGDPDDIKLELRREPKNKHDPNAVAVWCKAPPEAEGKLGFVPAENAEVISLALKEKRVKGVEMVEMGTRKGGKVWASIRIKLADGKDAPQSNDDFDMGEFFEDEDGEVYTIL